MSKIGQYISQGGLMIFSDECVMKITKYMNLMFYRTSFIDLTQMVCQRHQFEVKQVFTHEAQKLLCSSTLLLNIRP